MTQERLATLLGLLAATILLTAWISWRTGDARRDSGAFFAGLRRHRVLMRSARR